MAVDEASPDRVTVDSEAVDEAKETANREVVSEVRIRGNTNLATHQILRNVRTRPGRYFDPDQLRQDVDRLWKMKELRRVNGPFIEHTENGLIVTIEVVERSFLKKIRFVGNRSITDWQLKRQIQLVENQPLDVHEVGMARQQLEDYYRREGYLNTQVTVQDLAESGDQEVVFVIHEGAKERVWWVEFQGNSFASDARLRTFVKARPGFSTVLKGFGFNREEVDQDLLRLTAYYRTFGFFNARIGREIIQDPGNDWVRIRYVIDEGPRFVVNGVSFIGNQTYDHSQLETLLKLKPTEGAPPDFNSGEMNADVTALRDLYGSEGYVFADIQVEPRFLDEPGKLDLVYKIEEGEQYRVGKINVHIDGDAGITKRQVILNRMTVQPGDIADSRKLRSSEIGIRRSQVFTDGTPGSGPAPRVVVKPKDMQELERVAAEDFSDQ
jgi:outer membrane protein insertion porin family